MRKVLVVIPVLLVVVGLGLVFFGGSQAIRTFVSAFSPVAEWQTPAVKRVQLPAGNWVVFQRVAATDLPSGTPGDGEDGTNAGDLGAADRVPGQPVVVGRPVSLQSATLATTAAGPGLIDADDITVFGPQGRIATSCVYCSGSETLTLGSTRYVGIIRFRAAVEGEYTIATEVADETLIVSPPALQTVGQTFASLAWLGLGVLLIVGGAVWLLVLLILRLTESQRQGPVRPPTSWAPPSGPPVG